MQTLQPLALSRIPHLARSIAARRSQHQVQCYIDGASNRPRTAEQCGPRQTATRCWALTCQTSPSKQYHTCTASTHRSRPATTPFYRGPRHSQKLARCYTQLAQSKSLNSNRPLPNPLLYRPDPQTTEQSKHNRQGRPDVFFYSVASMFAAGVGIYVSFIYVSYTKAVTAYNSQEATNHIQQNADVSNRYDNLGRDYDKEVDTAEWSMRMGSKRRRVCGEAYGRVLEVGVGTGRNLKHYYLSESDESKSGSSGIKSHGLQAEVQSLTFLDKSPAMLAVARNKWADFFASSNSIGRRQPSTQRERWMDPNRVQWMLGDVGVRGVVDRPPAGYDCVVQTMGLCSYTDPVAALRVLGELVSQPGERAADDKGGKILLLEHGRGYYDWINRILDNGAPMHADHYGCWWNRDIKAIVERSGLVVERMRRYHLGTTWEVVLRPKPKVDM